MRVIKYFIFILIALALFSCETEQEQYYISIHIVNNADEDLDIHHNYGTLFSIAYSIPKKSSYTITGIKNIKITLKGKETGKNYGSKEFYSDAIWVVP